MNRIRALRKAAGYNQKELGSILGVGQTTVSAWEIERNEPDNESSNKMAKLFGCSIGYLMGYEPESKYRGLSRDEYYAFNERRAEEWAMKEAIESNFRKDEETESLIAEAIRIDRIEEWERSGKEVFPETIEIDAILERTDESGRKRALKVIELMFPAE